MDRTVPGIRCTTVLSILYSVLTYRLGYSVGTCSTVGTRNVHQVYIADCGVVTVPGYMYYSTPQCT